MDDEIMVDTVKSCGHTVVLFKNIDNLCGVTNLTSFNFILNFTELENFEVT